MASLLKNQILKVLSRFTKDVDADQIKFSSLSKAYLSNLVLNEDALTEVLELPAWLKLTRVVCNRVSLHIPWTQLSSQSIQIRLDEVYVDMTTCSELRPFTDTSPTAMKSASYGKTEMAVDGIMMIVNTLEVHFRAPTFHASFQVNGIRVFSTTPTYESTTDLRMTRLKDESRDAVLVFKCVTWQTLRIEASSSGLVDQGPNPSSIRLITNTGQVRIALKKHLSTCILIASRLQVILDDLLWVLTPVQLKAAFSLVDELKKLQAKADNMMKIKKAARKLEEIVNGNTRRARKPLVDANSANVRISQYFDKIDIMETSYHFHLGKMNLHISDEQRIEKAKVRKYEDAALLIDVEQLDFDYYPYHIPNMSRRHWLRYNEVQSLKWQNDCLGEYLRKLEKEMPNLPENPLKQLMATCCVFRVEDFHINNMTTRTQTSQEIKAATQFPMCCSAKKALHLPKNSPAVHFEYILYYFPGLVAFNAPPHTMSLYCNPVELSMDPPTIDWFTFICAELFAQENSISDKPLEIPDIICRVDMIYIKIFWPVEMPGSMSPGSPNFKAVQIGCGKIMLTNFDVGRDRSLSQSLTLINKNSKIFQSTSSFPCSPDDPDVTLFLDYTSHLARTNRLPLTVWSGTIDPIWVEFVDIHNLRTRPVPFVDAFPVTIWIIPVPTFGGPTDFPHVFALLDLPVTSVKAQLTNEGYNILLRALDSMYLVSDSLSANWKILFPENLNGETSAAQKEQVFCCIGCLQKFEFTMMLNNLSNSKSTDQISVISTSVDVTETRIRSLSDYSPTGDVDSAVTSSSGNQIKMFEEATFYAESDTDSQSVRSVMSEASMTELGNMEEQYALLQASVKDRTAIVSAPSSIKLSLCPDSFSDQRFVHLMSIEVNKVDLFSGMWTNFMVTKITCEGLDIKETNDMEISSAHERYYSGKTVNGELPSENHVSSTPSKIALRFQASQLENKAEERLLEILCRDASIQCSNEASSQLGSFFKSDLVADPLPLLLKLESINVSLFDLPDAESRKETPLPWRMKIPSMICKRKEDGIFVIEPATTPVFDDDRFLFGSRTVVDDQNISVQKRIEFLRLQRQKIDEEIKWLSKS